ncbi:MAG: phosphoribosylglycinamide formyltransferase [Bacillota bacterium]
MADAESMRLAVMASGRGSNLEAILNAADSGALDMEIALVVSDQGDAPALDRARRARVPSEVLEFSSAPDAYGRQLLRLLGEYQIDVVALAGFMRVLPGSFLQTFPGDVLNIHPSLLPAFPGLNAQAQALEYGVRVSGCTVHFVDEGVDTGPIILQAAVPVGADDDEESLSRRILRWEHRLYPRALQLYAEGRLCRQGRRVRILND